MNKKVSLLSAILLPMLCFSQIPTTAIYVSDLNFDKQHVTLSDPIKIKASEAYNNQPSFGPSNRIYFTAIADSSQADIYYYDEVNKNVIQVTYSQESEYSPTINSKNELCFVSVDVDSAQRLYALNMYTQKKSLLIPNEDSVGYYFKLTNNTIAYFALGNPISLKLFNETLNTVVIDTSIGRCMGLHPIFRELTYTVKRNDNVYVMMYDSKTKKSVWICQAINGSEDYAWLNDGSILMGKDGILYRINPMIESSWNQVADLRKSIGHFYRIVVNELCNRIAFVSYEGEKP